MSSFNFKLKKYCFVSVKEENYSEMEKPIPYN